MRILRSRSSQLISSINYPLPEYGSKTPRRSKTQINLVAPRFPTPVRRSSLNKKSLDLYRLVVQHPEQYCPTQSCNSGRAKHCRQVRW